MEILRYRNETSGFLDYHTYTHATDEVVLHSLINHLKIPFEIKESITYTNWVREPSDGPLTFHTKEDLEELLALDNHFLFARKFDATLGSFILEELDNKINK